MAYGMFEGKKRHMSELSIDGSYFSLFKWQVSYDISQLHAETADVYECYYYISSCDQFAIIICSKNCSAVLVTLYSFSFPLYYSKHLMIVSFSVWVGEW